MNRRTVGIVGAAVIAVSAPLVLLDSTAAQQTVTCDVALGTIPGVGEIRFCAYAPSDTTAPPLVTAAPTTAPPTTTTTTTTVAPPPRSILVGAAVERQGTESWAQATSRFEAAIGQPINIARRFTGTFPTSFAAVATFTVDTGERDRFISVKGNPTLAQWVTFFASIPNDGHDTWVTINDEPENDGGTMTPTVFKGKLRTMHDAWAAVGRPDIHLGAVLMTWLERDNIASTSSSQWFPDADIIADFTLGLDPYDPLSRQQFAALVGATLQLWDAAGGGPWMVTEVGTKRLGQDGADWIDSMFAYCRADLDCGGIMYFHAVAGADGPWLITDQLMLATYGRQAAR